MDMEFEKIVKEYELDEGQIELFHELKEIAPDNLSDEYIVWCMITKKLKSKILKSMDNFSGVIRKHLEHMIQGYFFVDHNIRGKNGEIVVFAKIDQYFEAKKVPERIVMEAHIHFLDCLNRYSNESLTKGLVIVADMRNFSMWKVPWELQRIMTPMAQKVPLRLKKIIIYYPPKWFSVAMAVVRRFMSSKMQKRVMNISSDCDLLKHVTGIPVELGGKIKRNPFRSLRDLYCRSDREKKLLKEIAVEEMKLMLSLSNQRGEERRKKKNKKKKKEENNILRRNRSLIDMDEMTKVVKETNLDHSIQMNILEEIRRKKEELQLEEIKKQEKTKNNKRRRKKQNDHSLSIVCSSTSEEEEEEEEEDYFENNNIPQTI